MMQEWLSIALEAGFSKAAELDTATLKPMQMVRDACATNRCGNYGINWTCPPACGNLDECAEQMKKYQRGLILQTVGKLNKVIDTKGYAEILERHRHALYEFRDRFLDAYPDALVLGSGGCSICQECAYPEPCRFPKKAIAPMEAYGLFVTQICKDNHVEYYYGPKTLAYTACILF